MHAAATLLMHFGCCWLNGDGLVHDAVAQAQLSINLDCDSSQLHLVLPSDLQSTNAWLLLDQAFKTLRFFSVMIIAHLVLRWLHYCPITTSKRFPYGSRKQQGSTKSGGCPNKGPETTSGDHHHGRTRIHVLAVGRVPTKSSWKFNTGEVQTKADPSGWSWSEI